MIVQAPVIALRMDASKCIVAFNQSADVGTVILRYTGKLLRIAAQTTACNRVHSLKERSARWLLMMYDRLQSDDMPLTHDFLSSMLGVRRTRVTEAAGELQRSGLIRYARGMVTILDHPGLSAAACECCRTHDRLTWSHRPKGFDHMSEIRLVQIWTQGKMNYRRLPYKA